MNAGECVQCGALNRLDDAGACPACASRVPCAWHPERSSVTRCSGCGKPACRSCAPFGICDACAAQLPAKGPAPVAVLEPVPARKLDRRMFLFAGLSALGAGLGALAARSYQAHTALAAQADQAWRVQAVWAAAASLRDAQGRYPAGLLALRTKLPAGVTVVGPGDPPTPGAVVYDPQGADVRLRLYDAAGQLVVREGAVWVVTGF